MNNDYLQEIMRCIISMEEHLSSTFLIKDMIQDSYYSYPHLERVFMAITGVSMNTYLRQRRLTKAAEELVSTQIPIIDIALKYSFSSQQTFTRAFHEYYQKSPNKVREEGRLDHMYDKFEVNNNLMDHLVPVDITIEKLPAFQVLSCYKKSDEIKTKNRSEVQNRVISEAWNQLIKHQMIYEYKKHNGFDSKIPATSVLGKFMIDNKLHILPNTRYFGFTSPYPYEENEFGYETWAMISNIDETALNSVKSDDVIRKAFEGGLYATATASYGENSNLDDVWRYLHYWLSRHEEYTYGEHEWLEEHLTTESEGGFHGFKLYLPIKLV